jgi:hypothetical protein
MNNTNDKLYVSAQDNFFSYWGKSRFKINRICFECDSLEEAEIVLRNLEQREEMEAERITLTKEENSKTILVHHANKNNAARWYQPNAWR